MNIKKILIVYKNSNLRTQKKIIELLKKILKDSNLNLVNRCDLTKKDIKGHNLIFSIGGDGTFLRTAHFITNELIMGINSDVKKSEGKLCSAVKENLKDKINKIKEDEFIIKKLTRVRVHYSSKDYDALNEIYVGSSKPYYLGKYILKFNNIKEEQKSSGIIISSGTGSSAWYKSITNNTFDPESEELRFVVREPYYGRLSKFNITTGRIYKNQKLYLVSKMKDGIIAIDSITELPFSKDKEIEIKISPKPLNVIYFKE